MLVEQTKREIKQCLNNNVFYNANQHNEQERLNTHITKWDFKFQTHTQVKHKFDQSDLNLGELRRQTTSVKTTNVRISQTTTT